MGLATKALMTLSARLLGVVFAGVVSIILARFLGPENRGIYAVLILVVSLASFLGNMGLGTANVYFLSKGRPLENVLWNSILASSVLGVVLILLTIPFLGIISDFAGGSVSGWLLLGMLAAIPFRIAAMYITNLFLGLERIVAYNVISILNGTLSLVPLMVFLYVFQDDLSGALWAYLASSIISLIIPSMLIWVRWDGPTRPSLDWELLKESLRFGLKGHLGNIAGFLNYRMDTLLVAYFVGASGVGLYSIAVGMAEMVGILPSAVALVLLPKVASSEGESAWPIAAASCRNVVLLSVVAAFFLLALGRPAIGLAYGTAFLPSYSALIALLPAMIALGIDRVLSAYLTGSGRPIMATYAIIVATAVNLGLNLVLIPRWGITGAAAASSVSYSVDAILVVAFSLRMSKGKLSDALLPRLSDIAMYRLMLMDIFRKLRPA